MRRHCLLGLSLFFLISAFAETAEPPGLINYQGVLRDSAGIPIDGTRDMVFRFYDADGGPGCVGGTLLLTDAHEATGSGDVVLAQGGFSVHLGSGTIAAGSVATIEEVFRDHDAVYMEVDVDAGGGAETLCPRIRVGAAPYALNADHLDGRDSSGYIDTSNATQVKAGDLEVEDLIVDGGDIFFPTQSRIRADSTFFSIRAGNQNSDDMFIHAGNDINDGALEMFGDGFFRMYAGNGTFEFYNGTTSEHIASLLFNGTLFLDGDIVADGGDLDLGPGNHDDLSAVDVETLTDGGLADSLHVHADIGDPITGDATVSGILDVGSDLEVSGDASFNRTLFMETTASGEPESDQSIYFYEDGTRTGESIGWDDSSDAFRLSDDLHFEEFADTFRFISHAYDLYINKDTDNDNADSWFRIFTDGFLVEQMRIEDGVNANTRFDGLVMANGLDYAEAFRVLDRTLEAGDVVSLSMAGTPGYVERAEKAYSPHLMGVVSEQPGFLTGSSFDAEVEADPAKAAQRVQARIDGKHALEKQLTKELMQKVKEQQRPVALAGRVPVKVDGAYGPIRPGDYLTSSPTPGHAMAMDRSGPSIGIAMEAWTSTARGKIVAFIDRGPYIAEGDGAGGGTSGQDAIERQGTPATVADDGVFELSGHLQVVLDDDTDDDARFSVFRDGDGGIGSEVFRVDEDGNVFSKGAVQPASMDVAEYFAVSEPVGVGDVLVMDRAAPGLVRRAASGSDPAVVGVVSDEPGVLLGSGVERIASADAELTAQLELARSAGNDDEEARLWRLLQRKFKQAHAPVALTGTVRCKVDAGYGAIRVGDLLTTSATPGHAMRADDPQPGTIIGKAIEALDAGTGTVKVLVMLR